MNNMKKAFVELIVKLAIVVIGIPCILVHFALHAGHERIRLSVKDCNGVSQRIYLKTNGEVVTLSKSPKTKMIAEQDNFFVIYGQSILYKNTADSLFIVFQASFMLDSLAFLPSPKDIAINYIYEDANRQDIINHYTAEGFSIFPSNGCL